jgi:hypothetical protein
MELNRGFLIILLFINYSCQNTKKVDMNIFELYIPLDWKYISKTGIDSHTGIIVSGSDTFQIDFGHYSEPLDEKVLILKKDRFNEINIKEIDIPVYFSDDPDSDYKMGKYLKQKVRMDTIDGRVAKIVTPKSKGHGIIGVYFPSLENGNKLSIYGNNVDSLTEIKFLRAIQSIVFR